MHIYKYNLNIIYILTIIYIIIITLKTDFYQLFTYTINNKFFIFSPLKYTIFSWENEKKIKKK
jgi:hypothetical protein